MKSSHCAFSGHGFSLISQFIRMQLENTSKEHAKAEKGLKGDLNSMTIHIPIKFKEHNHSQQGKRPQFPFSETIHIIPVARMMRKWIWKSLQNGADIFGQKVLAGIPFIFLDLELLPDRKWPVEAVTKTLDKKGQSCSLISTFLNDDCFSAAEVADRHQNI